jgi:TRAP-type C4-dicarboxylate transport system substrate-binding protein
MVVAVAALVVAGCDAGSGSTKAGGSGPPVRLRLGTAGAAGMPMADQVVEFARQVDDLSGGTLRIEPRWEANLPVQDDGDQVVARLVVAGDLEMGMIPARAWDTEGVTSLRALHAPFLVTTQELAGEIVTSDLAGEMLAGLDEIGIVGLGLVPEGVRHLFSFGDPMLAPDDFVGETIAAPRSDTTELLFEALGATTDDPGYAELTMAVNSGDIAAADSSFALATATLPAATTAAANVTLFPKVNSLVINADVMDGLTDDHQSVLQDAARRTVDWAIAAASDEAEHAEVFCGNGGRVVVASDDDIRALYQAVAPVYTELERDPTSAAMIDRIRTMGLDLDAAPTTASCGPSSDDASAGDGQVETAFPEGVYRAEITADFLMDAGIDRATAVNHAGVWTLSFRGGQFLGQDVNAASGRASDCPDSTYSVEAGRVTIHMGPVGEGCGSAAGRVLFSASWTLEGDRLRFADVRSEDGSPNPFLAALFGGQPFTKIG